MATGYNLIAAPLAAGALAPIGIVLPGAVGAMLRSAPTLIVALNAELPRRLDLRPEASTPVALERERTESRELVGGPVGRKFRDPR